MNILILILFFLKKIVLPDVWLAGGSEYFSGNKSYKGNDYYSQLKKAGYKTVFDKKELKKYTPF